MPKNITAGDGYAETQAWEVKVTLPADMAADGEVILLQAGNEKGGSDDGGFRIAGNKVFYSRGGEYEQLENVTLTAGVKYTLKRDLDLRDPEAFTSSYYVYDAENKLVGSAKDIPMSAVELPVNNITMSCNKIAGDAVLLDDYKLYPTGVTTDFELYGARLGMKVAEPDKAVGEDTAYRLSWMNATAEEKTYDVIAEYYNGQTVTGKETVSQVHMAPDTDGVETGVVKLADKGTSVRVYLQESKASADKEANLWLPIVIAVAAALAAGGIVSIVVFRKKAAGKPDTPVKDNTENTVE